MIHDMNKSLFLSSPSSWQHLIGRLCMLLPCICTLATLERSRSSWYIYIYVLKDAHNTTKETGKAWRNRKRGLACLRLTICEALNTVTCSTSANHYLWIYSHSYGFSSLIVMGFFAHIHCRCRTNSFPPPNRGFASTENVFKVLCRSGRWKCYQKLKQAR